MEHGPDAYFRLLCLMQAKYSYQNQALEFLATPTVSRSYRHAVAEVELYVSSSTNFDLQRAVKAFGNR